MTKYRLLTAAAWSSLAGALLLGSLPANAQDRDRGRAWGREARAEARANAGNQDASQQREVRAAAQADVRASAGNGWAGRRDRQQDARGARGGDTTQGRDNQGRDWAAQRQARDAASQQRQQQQQRGTWVQRDRTSNGDGTTTGWRGNRSTSDARTGGWQRDPSYGANARAREWQRDQRQDAYRAERRDDARNYANGYRAGRQADNRWGNDYAQNQRRWDSRSWRSDNRYDWYRYRASNRSLFSLGRYYAPSRGYSYSRIGIGFRLGSPFYANRYWINDPWQYRLPAVYGPYRWIRYYDDALLVDIYSGEVVDAIHNFFW